MLIVKKGDKLRRLTKGLLPFIVVLGVLNILVILEPDLSMAMTFTLIMGIMLFAGGVRIGHVVVLGILAIPLLWREVEQLQYALLRMTSFLNPGNAPIEVELPAQAVAHRGRLGRAVRRRIRHGAAAVRLPALSVQRLHWRATLARSGASSAFSSSRWRSSPTAWLGFRIAQAGAHALFSSCSRSGITFMTVSTAFLHIGVVIGLLPTTGLTLPFVSYGRTNLVMSLLMTGILVNIGSTRERVVGAHATESARDAARRRMTRAA